MRVGELHHKHLLILKGFGGGGGVGNGSFSPDCFFVCFFFKNKKAYSDENKEKNRET